jgi:hypothetical protein
MIHQEDIEKLIIAETDLWEDISDDGDGDYDEGTLVLSEEGEVVRDKLLNQKQPEGLEEETEAEKKEREDQEVEIWGRTN